MGAIVRTRHLSAAQRTGNEGGDSFWTERTEGGEGRQKDMRTRHPRPCLLHIGEHGLADLLRERETYPPMPHGYFDEETAGALAVIEQRARADRREERLADFPADLSATVRDTWRPAAAFMYRNWLRYLCMQKEQRLSAT